MCGNFLVQTAKSSKPFALTYTHTLRSHVCCHIYNNHLLWFSHVQLSLFVMSQLKPCEIDRFTFCAWLCFGFAENITILIKDYWHWIDHFFFFFTITCKANPNLAILVSIRWKIIVFLLYFFFKLIFLRFPIYLERQIEIELYTSVVKHYSD